MLSCPTCRGGISAGDRFCASCYTVFPSDMRRRNLSAQAAYTRTWKIPGLVAVAVAGVWLANLGFGNGVIEATPGQAGSGQAGTMATVQLKLGEWYDRSLELVGASSGTTPVFRLDGGDSIPCDSSALCEVTIHFSSGDTATYVLERSDDRITNIWPGDERGVHLLKGGRSGEIVWLGPNGERRAFPIRHDRIGRWLLDDANLSGERSEPTKPSKDERA